MNLQDLFGRWYHDEVSVRFYAERDNAYVDVYEKDSEDIIVSWRDEDVYGLIEDGFFKWKDAKSVIEYADSLGISGYPTEDKRYRVYSIDEDKHSHNFIGSFDLFKEASLKGRKFGDSNEIFILDIKTMKSARPIEGLFWN